jgi:hypothetical protein
MPFQSRKGVDFYYWCIVLHLHKLGYFYLQEGRNLAYLISLYVNRGRYSTNSNPGIAPSFTDIEKVLNLNLPVTLRRAKPTQLFCASRGRGPRT